MLNVGRIILTTLLVHQASYLNLVSSSITKLSSCACKYNGHIYNISSLAKTDGARFKASSRHYEYGYNPCIPFVQGDSQECQNVAICYWSDDGQMYDGIGFQQDVRCQVNKGTVELIFGQRGTRLGMVSTVQFKCNESKTLGSEAKMNIIRDAAEPILEVEHKCCCPDGCPVNVPPTTPPGPTVVSSSTMFPTFPVYVSRTLSYSFWIIVAVAAVFITVFLISIGCFCHRRASPSGYHGIVRTQRTPHYRPFLPANANDQSRAARSREQEEQDGLPGYGAVGGALMIPPPPYGDVHDDNDNETRREGVEHEEQPPDLRDALSFGVPEDGFTNPVQVSERMCSEKNK